MLPLIVYVVIFRFKCSQWITYPQYFKSEGEAEAIASLIEDDHECETDIREINVGIPGNVNFDGLTNLDFNQEIPFK